MNRLFYGRFNYLYYLVEASRFQISPFRTGVVGLLNWFESGYNPLHYTNFSKTAVATLEMAERMTRTYSKPEFGFDETTVNGVLYKINEEIIFKKTFCKLIHFKKEGCKEKQPKMLIVAPMAGHNATLLRETARDCLEHFDVYITDWISANQVPLNLGEFDMDDFIEYVIEFLRLLGKIDAKDGAGVHVMAVCQPTVPVIAAIALMSADKDDYVPKSMVLIGGPVDARKNPTLVNVFANDKNIEWFESMVITQVPANYPGYMRKVYPGFLQLAGFMSMNIQRHVDSHIDLFRDLLVEDDEKAEKQIKFYDEYLSVMDLTAEFYLQTIQEVFHDFSLAKNELVCKGRKVDVRAITKCALLGIEGEHDDIAGVGQTKEALNLCSGIPLSAKEYYLQKGVGHYGVFSGTKFRNSVIPVIRNFVYKVR